MIRKIYGLALILIVTSSFALPVITFPSATVTGSGDTTMDFLAGYSASANWANLSVIFKLDTSKVDLEFKSTATSTAVLLSSFSATTTLSTYLKGDTAHGMNGLAIGTATPLGAGIYQINLGLVGSNNPAVTSNVWLTGSGTGAPIKLIAHGSAIAAAGGTYSVPLVSTTMTESGGVFTTNVVPEPSSIFAFLTAGISFAGMKRRK